MPTAGVQRWADDDTVASEGPPDPADLVVSDSESDCEDLPGVRILDRGGAQQHQQWRQHHTAEAPAPTCDPQAAAGPAVPLLRQASQQAIVRRMAPPPKQARGLLQVSRPSAAAQPLPCAPTRAPSGANSSRPAPPSPASPGDEPMPSPCVALETEPALLMGCSEVGSRGLLPGGSPAGVPPQHALPRPEQRERQRQQSGSSSAGPATDGHVNMGRRSGGTAAATGDAVAAGEAEQCQPRRDVRDWSEDGSSGEDLPTPSGGQAAACAVHGALTTPARAARLAQLCLSARRVSLCVAFPPPPARLPTLPGTAPLDPERVPAGQRRQRCGLTGLTQLDPASIVVARPKPSVSAATWRWVRGCRRVPCYAAERSPRAGIWQVHEHREKPAFWCSASLRLWCLCAAASLPAHSHGHAQLPACLRACPQQQRRRQQRWCTRHEAAAAPAPRQCRARAPWAALPQGRAVCGAGVPRNRVAQPWAGSSAAGHPACAEFVARQRAARRATPAPLMPALPAGAGGGGKRPGAQHQGQEDGGAAAARGPD